LYLTKITYLQVTAMPSCGQEIIAMAPDDTTVTVNGRKTVVSNNLW